MKRYSIVTGIIALGFVLLYAGELGRFRRDDLFQFLLFYFLLSLVLAAVVVSVWDKYAGPVVKRPASKTRRPSPRAAHATAKRPAPKAGGRPPKDDEEWESDQRVVLYRLAPLPEHPGRWVRVDCRDCLSVYAYDVEAHVLGAATSSWTFYLQIPERWLALAEDELAAKLDAAIHQVYLYVRREFLKSDTSYPVVLRSFFTVMKRGEEPEKAVRYRANEDATVLYLWGSKS